MNKLLTPVRKYLIDFISLVYPNICLCCDNPLVNQESIMCTRCNIQLPRSHFHLVEGNPVEQLFWGRVPIVKATSYFIFKKGSRYQRLLHYLKYKGCREIHPKKEKKRGYNQSAAIAEGLSFILEKEVDTKNLFRKHYGESQTRKGRYERWENVNEIFDVTNHVAFANKHILLIDDVVTTGSTLEACALALLKSENTKVSIATLAFASI